MKLKKIPTWEIVETSFFGILNICGGINMISPPFPNERWMVLIVILVSGILFSVGIMMLVKAGASSAINLLIKSQEESK